MPITHKQLARFAARQIVEYRCKAQHFETGLVGIVGIPAHRPRRPDIQAMSAVRQYSMSALRQKRTLCAKSGRFAPKADAS